MTDEELAAYLNIPLDLVPKITPARRECYEHMHYVEQELNAGRVPPGVIVCHAH